MQQMPPWTTPDAYCQAVNSWTVLDYANAPVGDIAEIKICQSNAPHNASTCAQLLAKYTYSVWSSDHVFCLTGTTQLWLLFLFLAGALWVLLTVLRLFHTFDWRGLTGFAVNEVVKAVGGQVTLIVVAVSSFSLLLLVHQSNFLVVNSLVGGLSDQRVDSLWAKLDTLLSASQAATQQLDPNAWANGLFGGNLPDNSAPFGLTWGQIFGGLGSLESFLLSTLLPVRFAAEFVAVVTAPLAIMAFGLPYTRRFFWMWFEFWLEIEVLATGSAIVLAAYQQLHTSLQTTTQGGLAPTEQAIILLAFAGLICGGNLTFLWKIIGSFLSNITSFYQQQYQRERQFWGIMAQAAVGIAGAVATVMTGGAALPFALAAEGLTSGIEELGAVPASPVPGSGVGRAFLSAGGAADWHAGAATGTPAGGSRGSASGGTAGTSAGPSGGGSGGGPGSPGAGPGGFRGPVTVTPVPSDGSTGGSGPGGPLSGPGGAPTGLLPAPALSSPGGAGPGGPGSAGPTAGAPSQVSPLGGVSGPGAAPGPHGSPGPGSAPGPQWGAGAPGVPGAPASPADRQAILQARVQAASALPNVLDQVPLAGKTQQALFAPWKNSRGEEILAKEVFASYLQDWVTPDSSARYDWQGIKFLHVGGPGGTGVPVSSIESRLQAAPYLRDALTLGFGLGGQLRPDDVPAFAQAMGTLYHQAPKDYPDQVAKVEQFLQATVSMRAADPERGLRALLHFMRGLDPRTPGGQP